MIDLEKLRLFVQALKPDLPGVARQIFVDNPKQAWQELPGKLQASRELLNQYQPGQGIDPRLMDQFMNLTGSFAPAGIFIGTRSQLFDKKAGDLFKQLEKEGVSPQEAWQQTGTFRAPDGKLRQEIHDSSSKMLSPDTVSQIYEKKAKEMYGKSFGKLPINGEERNRIINSSSYEINLARTLPGNFQHEELYKAYPELRRIQTLLSEGPQLKGTFDGKRIEMEAPSSTEMRRGVLHESQHAIQDLEDFARGGSPYAFAKERQIALDRAGQINAQLSDIAKKLETATPDQRQVLQNQYNTLLSDRQSIVRTAQSDPYEMYRRLAGEAEARLVEKRADYPMAKRREILPTTEYDVPIEELIIRGLLN